MQDLANLPYKTSDTGLAAWLHVSGLKLEDIDTVAFPCVYYFEYPHDNHLGDLLLQWESGLAQGNISSFYKTYRYLLRQVKKGE